MGQVIRETWAAGRDGKAIFRDVTIDIFEWSIEVGGDDAPLTHSGSDGVKLDMAVTDEYTGSFSGHWKFSNQPTDDRPKPGLYRGEVGTLKLFVGPEGFIQVEVEIKTFSVTSEVEGGVDFTSTWKATARPTWPGTSAFSSSSSSVSSSSSST